MWVAAVATPSLAHEPQCTIPVVRVIDGDTFTIRELVILGNGHLPIISVSSVRLLRVDTPERGEPDFKKAKEMLATLVSKGIALEVTKRDGFGRWLAEVYLCVQGATTIARRSINDIMIEQGWKYTR
jgi:endonuclease YncB( thermonuclease family)